MNQILYFHRVYPLAIFERRKWFNLVVNVLRSPPLNLYLELSVSDFLRVLLQNDGVNAFSVVLYDSRFNADLERYSVKLNMFPRMEVSREKIDTILAGTTIDDEPEIRLPGFDWTEIYSQFRLFLYRFQNELKRTKGEVKSGQDADNDADANIFYRLTVDTAADLTGNTNWVRLATGEGDIRTKITPLGEVDTGFLVFSMVREKVKP